MFICPNTSDKSLIAFFITILVTFIKVRQRPWLWLNIGKAKHDLKHDTGHVYFINKVNMLVVFPTIFAFLGD